MSPLFDGAVGLSQDRDTLLFWRHPKTREETSVPAHRTWCGCCRRVATTVIQLDRRGFGGVVLPYLHAAPDELIGWLCRRRD